MPDPPHGLKSERVLEDLDSQPDGLSGDETRRRIERYGENEIVAVLNLF